MMPISLYSISVNLEFYVNQVKALVVSKFESDRENYKRFLSTRIPNSKIDISDYQSLHQRFVKSINYGYDVLILDNDAFFVDENPALDNLASLTEFIDRDRIIITSATTSQELLNKINKERARFIEKGKWRTLEETIKLISGKYSLRI